MRRILTHPYFFGSTEKNYDHTNKDFVVPGFQDVIAREIPGIEMPEPVRELPNVIHIPAINVKKVGCNCKNSKCIKLYCDCFKSQTFCKNCECVNCINRNENEERQIAIGLTLAKNPKAFESKLKLEQPYTERAGNSSPNASSQQDGQLPSKGCNCKQSNCKKKYCECY